MPKALATKPPHTDPEHISRPRNAFFCFRSFYSKQEQEPSSSTSSRPGARRANQTDVSCSAAHAWNAMSPAQRAPYVAEARKERERHKERYPEWKYQPQPKGTGTSKAKAPAAKKRRKTKSRASAAPVDSEADQKGPELTPFVDHATIHKPASPFAFNLTADMDSDWTVSNDFISDAESPYAPGSSSSLVESEPPFPLPILLSDEELLAAFAAAAPPESWDTHTENSFASEFCSAQSGASMNSESTYSGFYREPEENYVLFDADISRTSGLGLSFDGESEYTQDASVDIDLDAIMGFGADMFPSVDDPTGTGFLQSFTDFASSTAAGRAVDSWGY